MVIGNSSGRNLANVFVGISELKVIVNFEIFFFLNVELPKLFFLMEGVLLFVNKLNSIFPKLSFFRGKK